MRFRTLPEEPSGRIPGVVSKTVYEAERTKFQAETRRTQVLSDLLRNMVDRLRAAVEHHNCDLCRADLNDAISWVRMATGGEGFGLLWAESSPAAAPVEPDAKVCGGCGWVEPDHDNECPRAPVEPGPRRCASCDALDRDIAIARGDPAEPGTRQEDAT